MKIIYGSWNIKCNRQKFLSFCAIFCPFSPLTNLKIKILKLKKKPGDVIILHICTINANHVMYGSWDMESNKQYFLSFWTVFCPLTPLTTQIIKILKKKKYLEILSFYTKVQSHDVWSLRYEVWQTEFFVILDQFLPFYPSNNPKSQNFEKLKKSLELPSFYSSVSKTMVIFYTFP